MYQDVCETCINIGWRSNQKENRGAGCIRITGLQISLWQDQTPATTVHEEVKKLTPSIPLMDAISFQPFITMHINYWTQLSWWPQLHSYKRLITKERFDKLWLTMALAENIQLAKGCARNYSDTSVWFVRTGQIKYTVSMSCFMLGGNAAGSPVPVLDSFLLVDIMSMYAGYIGYIHIHLFIVIYSDTPRQPKLFAPV